MILHARFIAIRLRKKRVVITLVVIIVKRMLRACVSYRLQDIHIISHEIDCVSLHREI